MIATTAGTTPHQTLATLVRAQIQDDSPETSIGALIGLPFHGSCPRCHHFHRGYQFTFSPNPTQHRRLRCEECGHQMFGLGRASTQLSLASIETNTSNTQRCVELETIRERNSPAASLSTPIVRERAETLAIGEDVRGISDAQHPATERPASPKSAIHSTSQPQHERGNSLLQKPTNTIRFRLRKRIRRARLWDMPKLGIRFMIQPYEEDPGASLTLRPTSSGTGQGQVTLGRNDGTQNTAPPISPTSATPRPASHSVHAASEQARTSMEAQDVDEATREECLRKSRYENTRKRKATQACACSENCSCRIGFIGQGPNVVDTNSASNSRGRSGYRTSLSQSSDSNSPQPGPRPGAFAFLGSLFDGSSMPLNTGYLRTVRRRNQVRSILAQSSRSGSEGSSTSLYLSRPSLLARSSSTPALSASPLASQYATVGDVLRRVHILHQVPGFGVQPSGLAWLNSGVLSRGSLPFPLEPEGQGQAESGPSSLTAVNDFHPHTGLLESLRVDGASTPPSESSVILSSTVESNQSMDPPPINGTMAPSSRSSHIRPSPDGSEQSASQPQVDGTRTPPSAS